MKDWRLEGSSALNLKNQTFKKIIFPDFWNKAYAEKNDFFQSIKLDGEMFVEKYGRGKEFLVGDKIQDFWHEHCVLCTDKITTRDNRVCFCADNYSTWVCQTCYEDFKAHFNWNEIN